MVEPASVGPATRYVLVKGGPDKPLDKLVKLKNGVGVRATAHATSESDYTHFFAVHGKSASEALSLANSLPLGQQSKTMSFTPCITPDCLAALTSGVKPLHQPSWIEPFTFVVFVCVEFEVRVSAKKPPKIQLETEIRAAVVNKSGNRMLIELSSMVEASVDADLVKLRAWKGAKRVTVLRTGADAMHRVLP